MLLPPRYSHIHCSQLGAKTGALLYIYFLFIYILQYYYYYYYFAQSLKRNAWWRPETILIFYTVYIAYLTIQLYYRIVLSRELFVLQHTRATYRNSISYYNVCIILYWQKRRATTPRHDFLVIHNNIPCLYQYVQSKSTRIVLLFITIIFICIPYYNNCTKNTPEKCDHCLFNKKNFFDFSLAICCVSRSLDVSIILLYEWGYEMSDRDDIIFFVQHSLTNDVI